MIKSLSAVYKKSALTEIDNFLSSTGLHIAGISVCCVLTGMKVPQDLRLVKPVHRVHITNTLGWQISWLTCGQLGPLWAETFGPTTKRCSGSCQNGDLVTGVSFLLVAGLTGEVVIGRPLTVLPACLHAG